VVVGWGGVGGGGGLGAHVCHMQANSLVPRPLPPEESLFGVSGLGTRLAGQELGAKKQPAKQRVNFESHPPHPIF